MKVRFIGESDPFELMNGKVYEVLDVKYEMYKVVDETGEDYYYPDFCFEIVEEDK